MLRKRIVVIALLFLLLAESFPIVYAERTTSTFYFHEVEESYLGGIGSIGVLNGSFPSKENISDAARGTYSMEDVLEISGDMVFDLYFNVPLVNVSPNVIDELINLTSKFANVTIGNFSLSNITKFLGIIFENLTKVKWSVFLSEIANLSLGREERFIIRILDGSELIKEKVVTIKRYPKNLSNLDLSMLFSPKKKFSERNIRRITFVLKGVVYHAKSNAGTLTITVEAENELAWVREVLSGLGELNATFVIEILKELGFENLSKRENFVKLAISFFNILKPLLESILNVSFVYDSCKYPSSVTITGKFVERKERGKRRYFLSNELDGEKRALSDVPPLLGEESQISLSSDGERWILYKPFKSVTRIHGEVKVCLYIDYPSYGENAGIVLPRYKIKATLVELDQGLNEVSTIASNFTYVITPFAKNITYIELNDVDHVVEKGHTIALDVKWDIPYLFGDLLKGMEPTLKYNCTRYLSYVELSLFDPDDIKLELESPSQQKILRSGEATFKIKLSNKGKGGDTVNVTIWLIDLDFAVTPAGWNCAIDGLSDVNTYAEEGIRYERGRAWVGAEESAYIIVTITPPESAEYGKKVALNIYAEGERGRDNITCYLQLSEELRVFNVEIVKPDDAKVRIGKSHTYTFEIKNAGNDIDTFIIEANSSNNWDIDIEPHEVKLAPNERAKINVTVHVPSYVKEGTEDFLTFMVVSKTNSSDKNFSTVITTAIAPTVIQLISEFFDSAAGALHLDKTFGPSAGMALMIIVFVIVAIVVLVIIYMMRREFAELICLDRIKEVEPGKEAIYNITLRNPTRRRLTYKVSVNEEKIPDGWKIEIPEDMVVLDPSESKELKLIVKPTSEVDPEGWAEVELQVTPAEKSKTTSISVLAIVKGAEPKLKITGVFHWPKIFKAGDTITTRFTLRNDGNVTARDISVVLSVNGIEKNRIDGISIPAGGYADIKLPWVAVEGRNRLRIVVKKA